MKQGQALPSLALFGFGRTERPPGIQLRDSVAGLEACRYRRAAKTAASPASAIPALAGSGLGVITSEIAYKLSRLEFGAVPVYNHWPAPTPCEFPCPEFPLTFPNARFIPVHTFPPAGLPFSS